VKQRKDVINRRLKVPGVSEAVTLDGNDLNIQYRIVLYKVN